ncbi:class II aldolase/adducin family protein [Streptomyces sp. RFCAC02]|uniref:class II aldolase/adducin family protein n=1 Tax=Streptomyces sp. RFCAC02 TaxID=2499143 RepID=UPI00101F0CB2|nr:class II aldolase/adducin family protein [Streptomyces sp. RFCAC02]
MNLRQRVPDSWRSAWTALLDHALRAVADGLVVGTSGNLSVRVGGTVLVTPSGVPYERLGARDLLAVDLADGRVVHGALPPTSELPLHLAVLRATGAGAVVHTHAVHATAVSTLVDELPAIHYMTAALGGPVRVAPYARYGSEDLARHAVTALRDRTACLLRNHGTLVVGRDLHQAYENTQQLEWMCRVWLAAAAVPGRAPTLLSPAELDDVARHLRGYGTHGAPVADPPEGDHA